MTKKDLANVVAEKTGLTKKDSHEAVNAVFEAITESLQKGEEIQLIGFGTFSSVKKEAKPCRNPHTGETMMSEEKMVPKFKAGAGLKKAVNA